MESLSPDRHRPEKRREILRVSLLLILITLATKALAYVVQMKKASYFGIGPIVDCFEWAIFFPSLIYSFAVNVLNVLLVPIFGGRKASAALDRAYHVLVSWCLVAFLLLGLLLLALAPTLVEGLSEFDDTRRRSLATLFLSILACATFFIGIEGVQTGFLLSDKRVVSVALVRLFKEIIFVLLMIFGFVWLGEMLLPGAWLAAAATGGIVFFLLGFSRHRFSFQIRGLDETLRRLLRNFWPVLLLFGLINLNELVRMYLLSKESGDLATYRYAYYIFLLPHVLIAENLVLFLFPVMASEINENDLGRLRHSIRSGIKLILFFILPASVGLIVLAQPIVQIIYERNEFTSADTRATVLPLIWLSVGMWAFSVHILLARTLDAMQAYWRRIAVEGPFVVLSIVLSWWWIRWYGYTGAAAALTVSIVFLLVMEGWQIRLRIETIRLPIIFGDLVKIGVAAGIMGMGVQIVFRWTDRWFAAESLPGQVGRLGTAVISGVLLYFACVLALRIIRAEDFAELRNYFRRRRAARRSGNGEERDNDAD